MVSLPGEGLVEFEVISKTKNNVLGNIFGFTVVNVSRVLPKLLQT